MEKSATQKLNLGIFVVIGTLILVSVLYFIGNRQNLFGKIFKVSAVFNNVNGLQLGNNVRYSGINVGTVKGITMINDSTICVDMVIEEKILPHLKKNAVAAVGSDGLVGSMIINIVPGKELSSQLKSGDTIKSYMRITSNDMMSTLNTTNENAALLTSDLLKITEAINRGEGTFGMLLKDSILASNIYYTIKNLKTISNKTTKTIDEINKIITAINYDQSIAAVVLSDSISAKKVKSIIDNLEMSSKDINKVVSNLNDVVVNIKQGKGTLNYMVKDTVLVKNIDETVKNIKEGSVRLNENLEALKHNFFFRGYFKKLEKQKANQNQ
ncbi:MAG: MlaD family protein [Flavobacteriaceae bacterium]|nr:MlaD family protein [Flavobacteriaceae bacterium]